MVNDAILLMFILKDSCASAAILEERPGTHLTEEKEKSGKDKLATGNLMPKGGTRSIHDGWGGPTYFFGLKIYTLGIFWGQEICHIFF